MKLMLTLDFPPEIGGIQRYLENIVRFTYGSEDLVMVGCRRKPPTEASAKDASAKDASAKDASAKLRVPIAWVSGPFSRCNKKFALAPMLLKYVLLVFAKSELFEVECGNVYAASVPWAASFLTGVHYTVYVHGTELLTLRAKTWKSLVLRRILIKARAIIANSGYTASLIKDAKIDTEIIVRPPKIALPERPIDTARSHGGGMHILCVGRLVAHKGHAILLEAVSMVPGNIPWRLVIVGDGPQSQDLHRYCKEKNLIDRVSIFRGLSDDDLACEYEKASVFVLPSLEVVEGVEGFGIVLLEAMAHGVPIVASFVGGISEVLDAGSCGVLVEAGNAVALAHALIELHKDPVKRSRLIANAFRRVRTHYAW